MKSNQKVTDEEIIKTIRNLWFKLGYSPSYKELADELNISASTLFNRLKRLRKEGFVNYVDSSPRTLTVTKDYIIYREDGR